MSASRGSSRRSTSGTQWRKRSRWGSSSPHEGRKLDREARWLPAMPGHAAVSALGSLAAYSLALAACRIRRVSGSGTPDRGGPLPADRGAAPLPGACRLSEAPPADLRLGLDGDFDMGGRIRFQHECKRHSPCRPYCERRDWKRRGDLYRARADASAVAIRGAACPADGGVMLIRTLGCRALPPPRDLRR